MNSLTILQSWLTSPSVRDVAVQMSREMTSLVSYLALVVGWSMIRPGMIRDYDKRPLPNNPTARIAFAIITGAVYLALAMGYLLVSGLTDEIIKMLPVSKGVLEAVKTEPALLSAVTLGALLQFSFFRDLEQSAIVWLHNRRQTFEDETALADHLVIGPFEPSAAEQRKNRESARQFGIYVTDDTFDKPGLVTFNKWRKVSSLVRFVREWNADQHSRALDDEAMKTLGDIETAHGRKTELAVNIVKMVNEVEQGGEASKALAQMMKLLSDTPHIDRAHVAAAEARAKMILSGTGEDVANKPLRLTGEQLRNHLSQIERYFEVEYEILLEQVAGMAAKSALADGEKSAERLEALRVAGVGGLGSIQRYDLNHVSWAFLGVSLLGFLILFMGYSTSMTAQQVEGLARFTFGMSVATLIGAIIGSRRRYARAANTKWGVYILWGVFAGACFIGISKASYMVKIAHGLEPPALTMYQLMPWALLPCFTTIAIARLARLHHWPTIPGLAGYRGVYVRLLDALCVSLALYAAYCLAIALHPLLGVPLPLNVQKMMDVSHRLPIPVNWTVQTVGLMIGALVLRDVRWAAHASIIAQPVGKKAPPKRPDAGGKDQQPPAQAA